MSTLGDVVFCVDCDSARQAHADSAALGLASAVAEPPRRMATKRDANRDPLCAGCLDARHESRHAEFMLNEGRAPAPDRTPAQSLLAHEERPAQPGRPAFIRITRTRTADGAPLPTARQSGAAGDGAAKQRSAKATANGKTNGKTNGKAKLEAASHATSAPRVARPPSRSVERKFALLVVEVGYLRARQLLDELAGRNRKLTR
jgi:hypothetical protein